MVRQLTLLQGEAVTVIPLDHPRLRDGWWALENDGCGHARWTNGRAELPLDKRGPVLLEVTFGALFGYRLEPGPAPQSIVRAAG
jgi:hypothetical protein